MKAVAPPNRARIAGRRPAPRPKSSRDTESSSASILLVDDSHLFRERLARAFRKRGFTVLTAGDYDQAMRVAQRHPPDLAVVDLRMPGRNGLELVRDLVQIDATVRILVLSGFGSIATAVDAVKLGAVNFLPKPADADDILAAFERAEAGLPESSAENHDVPSLARAEWEHIHRILSDCGGKP